MVLQLLLVLANLLFHLVECLIESWPGIVTIGMGDKIVFVFRVDEDLGIHSLPVKIESHLDRRHSFEVRQKFLGLSGNVVNQVGLDIAMTAGNRHLH